MDKPKIITNYRHIPLLDGNELTEKEKKELDYIQNINTEYRRFFRYKNWIYDIHEFMKIDNNPHNWDGYFAESYFSSVLVRFVPDTNQEVIQAATMII